MDGGGTKHPFLPLFDGHSQSYQQWVKGTKIYHLKLNVYNKLSEGIDNIIQSLRGKLGVWLLALFDKDGRLFFCQFNLMETFRVCLEGQDKSLLYPPTTMTRSCDPATAANTSEDS